VRATDAAGNLSLYSNVASATTPAPPDTSPPTAPANLSAAASSATQIDLAWNASTDNVGVKDYQVERCTGAGCTNFAFAGTTTGTTYSDGGRAASTSYRYRVRATDAAGNLSLYSNVASATTPAPPDTSPPTAPANLSAAASSATQIDLAWTASTDNVGVKDYQVERCTGAGCTNFAFAGTTTGASYSDGGRAADTTYSYQVRATDAAGNLSDYSAVASATTPPPPDSENPTAPGLLVATPTVDGQIDLSWGAAGDNVGVAEYLVERCSGLACAGFVQIGTTSGTSYSDSGLAAATSYSYRVRAADAAGNRGAYSNVATALTLAAPDTTPPTAPSNLVPTVTSPDRIRLNWTASVDDVGVSAYLVERCKGITCTGFVQVAVVANSPYEDTGLEPNTPYRYRVRAKDAAGNLSLYSNVVTAITLALGL
jgi:chitodextrinase